MKTYLVLLLMVLQIIVSCNKSATTPAERALFNMKSTMLMTIPAGYEIGEPYFSKDGYQIALVLKKDNKAFMNINGAMGNAYDDVHDFIYSQHTKDTAFIARKGKTECIVANGTEHATYDLIVSPVFTKTGTLVYAAKRQGLWYVVSGQKESQPFSADDIYLFVSPDGTRLAYVAQNPRTKKYAMRVCRVDFTEVQTGMEYDYIQDVRNDFSTQYLIYRVGKGKKQAVVLFDYKQPGIVEKEFGWFDEVNKYTLSQNGLHSAILARQGKQNLMIKDGIESVCPPLDMTLDISINNDGKVLYTGVVKNAVSVFVDGSDTGNAHETVENLLFSHEGQHMMYIGGFKSRYFTVIDNSKSLLYDKIVTPHFSPNNAFVVYRARTGGERFVVVADTKTGQVLTEHPHYDAIWDVTFSPDGTTVGYGVKDGPEMWWKAEKLKNTTPVKGTHESKH